MSNFTISLPQLYNKYVDWVASNPNSLGDVEMSVKWISYLVAGKIHNSSVVTELVYSLSNLLVLFNDRIIEKANSAPVASGTLERRIKMILTTLEYCEVFIELSAFKIYGSSGRWFFIFVIQSIKCIGRLILTLCCNQNNKIVQSPPIPQLDRKNIEGPSTSTADNASFRNETLTNAYVLKRSGKVLRKIDGSPPVFNRSWKPLDQELRPVVTPSDGRLIKRAELLYILKPMIHLAAMRKFGYKSWKSYGTALALDLESLRLYYKNRTELSKSQKLELSRRCVSLLLYLMRSPLYDRVTKDKIASILNGIGNNIPLTGTIMQLILSYIPHWQETYFYMWST